MYHLKPPQKETTGYMYILRRAYSSVYQVFLH